MSDKDIIRGLIHEREVYEKRGEKGRVKQVDEELKRLGAEGKTKRQRATKRQKPQTKTITPAKE